MTFKKNGAKKVEQGTTQGSTGGAKKRSGNPRRLGEVLKTKDGSSLYLKLGKKITVHQDDGSSQTIEADSIINLNRPVDFFNFLHEAGHIDEAELEAKTSDYGEGGRLEFVRFFVNLPTKK